MSVELRDDQISSMPIHDANYLRFCISEENDAGVIAELDVSEIDDSFDPGYKYPQNKGVTRIRFDGCLLVNTRFFGGRKYPDSIDNLSIIDGLELSDPMKKALATAGSRILALRILLHSGSVIEILTERVTLTTP